MPKTESITIPVQNLNHILSFIAEYKQVTGQWVHFQMLRHENLQTVNRFAHIRGAACQKYPNMRWKKTLQVFQGINQLPEGNWIKIPFNGNLESVHIHP